MKFAVWSSSCRTICRIRAAHVHPQVEGFERGRRQIARLVVEQKVNRLQARAAVTSVEVHFEQNVLRQLHEEVVQFIVEDDVLRVPMIGRRREIVRTKRLVVLVGFVTARVGRLRAVTRQRKDEVVELARFGILDHRSQIRDDVRLGRLRVGQRDDVRAGKAEEIGQHRRHVLHVVDATV